MFPQPICPVSPEYVLLPDFLTSFSRLNTAMQYMIGTQISYCVCLGFARASLLLQLLRLAPSPKMRRFYWTLFALNALVTVITLSISVFKCPRRSGIHPEDVPAFIKSSCRVFFPIRFTVAVMGVVMDFVCWLAPLKLI